MAEFVVRLADERGRMQEQVHAAATAEELRQRFSTAGYYVHSVKAKGIAGAHIGGKKKPKLEPFLIFNQQFLTLIKAGLPILSSLDLLARRQRNVVLAGQLQDVAMRVKTGQPLSVAFEAQGGFPLIYTTTLLAGERAGNLEEVLSRYLQFQKLSLTFRKKLVASLVYPVLLVVLIAAMLLFLLTFVVPKFAALYDQIGTELPAITVFLLTLGQHLQTSLPILVVVLLGGGFGLYKWAGTDTGADWIDGFRMRLPLCGNIWLKYQVALFARTLSTLLTGGLPLVPSLDTAARSIDSRRIAKAVGQSVIGVREGKGLANSLEATKVFPDLSVEMIEVGESTGALPDMLNSVAEFFEEDVQTALTSALSLIEPLMLIVTGVAVLGILLALYWPIFSLGATGIRH